MTTVKTKTSKVMESLTAFSRTDRTVLDYGTHAGHLAAVYRLEAEGFECVLADAKQARNLPGRPPPFHLLAQLARAAARRKIAQLEEALEGAEFFIPSSSRAQPCGEPPGRMPGHTRQPGWTRALTITGPTSGVGNKLRVLCPNRLAGFQNGQVADREPVVLDLLIHHDADAVDHGALLVRVTGSGRALA